MKNYQIFFVSVFISAVACADSAQLAPPKFNVQDKFGINVPTGQVTTSVDTLSIGGGLGLSHNIATYSSNFLMKGGTYTVGVHDKFGGAARYEELISKGGQYIASNLECLTNCYDLGFWVMRVNDHESSMDFKVMDGNNAVAYAAYSSAPTSGYTYKAVKDSRHTLVVPASAPNYLLWTKENGVQVWFRRSPGQAVSAATTGYLEKVVYPNGFIVNYQRNSGDHTVLNVATNTGFQLKYNYVQDNSSNQGIGASNTSISIPAENTINWSLNNPKTIVGINTSIEYCANSSAKVCYPKQKSCPSLVNGQQCNLLVNKWPLAEFYWPVGMPRAFYFGESSFKVVDSANRTTSFRIKAFDTALNESGQPATGIPAGQTIVPRVVGITYAGSSLEGAQYEYKNYFDWDESETRDAQNVSWGAIKWAYKVPGEIGYIKSASGLPGSFGYVRAEQAYTTGGNPNARKTFGADGMSVIQRTDLAGAYHNVIDIDGEIQFDPSFSNRPVLRIPKKGPTETYTYDARGNLSRITYNKGLASESFIEASFPAACTNPKTCNQADWVSDAKGNKTEYKYHAESGQVERIIYPANKRNIRAETRFKYEQKYAKYYTEAGSKSQSPDGIWLKTEESSCIDSAMDESGNCALNDKVTTRYEYLSDNLFMTGMTVTSQKDGNKTLRTCYQYDIYGNRIGETQPKANLASCN